MVETKKAWARSSHWRDLVHAIKPSISLCYEKYRWLESGGIDSEASDAADDIQFANTNNFHSDDASSLTISSNLISCDWKVMSQNHFGPVNSIDSLMPLSYYKRPYYSIHQGAARAFETLCKNLISTNFVYTI